MHMPGFGGIGMKTCAEHNIKIPLSSKRDIQKGLDLAGNADLESQMPIELDDEEDPADENINDTGTDEAPDADVPVVLFTFESTEKKVRELLGLYLLSVSANNNSMPLPSIFDFTPGQGFAALACIRHGVKYTGFTRSELHTSICRQTIKLTIVTEILDQISDGFLQRRFLCRERSLGGSEPKPHPKAPREARRGACKTIWLAFAAAFARTLEIHIGNRKPSYR